MTLIRLPRPFSTFLKRFRREDGSMAVEMMIMLPVLIWGLLGTWVFFDAFRAQFTNAKAGYTLGDILSRETAYITPEYIDSLYELQRFLVGRTDDIRLRVSVISYDEDDDEHSVVWSVNRGGGGTISDSDLPGMLDRIPIMADGGRSILVQTSVDYVPIYGGGLGEMEFDDFVVTRPRFAAQVCWNSVNENPTVATATC